MVQYQHVYPWTVQRAIKGGALSASLTKPASMHTLRHSFTTHLLKTAYNIGNVQKLWVCANISATLLKSPVLTKGG